MFRNISYLKTTFRYLVNWLILFNKSSRNIIQTTRIQNKIRPQFHKFPIFSLWNEFRNSVCSFLHYLSELLRIIALVLRERISGISLGQRAVDDICRVWNTSEICEPYVRFWNYFPGKISYMHMSSEIMKLTNDIQVHQMAHVWSCGDLTFVKPAISVLRILYLKRPIIWLQVVYCTKSLIIRVCVSSNG